MSKPKPVQSCPPAPADTTNDEEKTREPQILNPRKKAILAKLFMHNPQFAETFFKARIGEEGMIRFYALQAHISTMPEEGLKSMMEQRVVGTLTLLSKFFDPSESEPDSPSSQSSEGVKDEKSQEKEREHETKEKEEVRVKMNKWCWIFFGAWTVGEAGRVLEHRKLESRGQIST